MTTADLSSSQSPIRVLVTDSTRMGSQLLADAMQRDSQFEIVAVCASGEETMNALQTADPDVAVIGMNLDEQPMKGLEICRLARTQFPECKTILLLESSKKESVLAAFGAGARGVFCRAEDIETLRKCIRVVHTGQIWANYMEMRYVLDAFADAAPTRLTDSRGTVLLSKRQQDIVKCITEGLTNREIAARLKLSEHTVKNYIFRIFDRLGVSTRVEMVLYAFSQRDQQKMSGNGRQPGISLDDLPEIERYRRLAEFESVLSPLRLAEMYRDGRGTQKDKVSASTWFMLAERIGNQLITHARQSLDAMSGQLETHETREAERRTAEWLSDHELLPEDAELAATAHEAEKEKSAAPRAPLKRKARA
jgi:DNA-binding NarL/FixJ family response regulator